MTRVLVVDDDPVQLRLTAEVANRAGFRPLTATGGEQALAMLREDRQIGAMILDLVMPDLDGMGVMAAMRQEGLTTPVIIQTANASLETVISAMRQGAADYFVKPVAPERLVVSLRNAMKLDTLEAALRAERARRGGTFSRADMIASAPAMARVLTLCAKAARSAIPVLIEGETGVGKELVARIVQGTGERAGKPFVAVNCGAIPPNLVESVLFGHKKGAFTGALADQPGKFSEAHGGTLFLDEVGELPLDTQVKLLRALQEGEIEPLGASRPEKVNVRLISATNRRLLNLTKAGAFREDLYYRLNVFPIYVPPLRERLEDLAALVEHFIVRFAAEAGKRVLGISPKALDLLAGYNWPGNVRQLENAVYRAVVLCDGAFLETQDFPQIVAQSAGRAAAVQTLEEVPDPGAPVHIDAALPGRRRSVVISGAGDRRDQDITEQTEILGSSFDDVILYQDACQRGRADGEVLALLHKGLQNARRASYVTEIHGEFIAIDHALARLKAGDLCLVLVDQVQESLAHLQQRCTEAHL